VAVNYIFWTSLFKNFLWLRNASKNAKQAAHLQINNCFSAVPVTGIGADHCLGV
jgi:hypothetical protein